jgi:glycosyltransferase involved in cell wall biosynthesis
MITFTVVTCTFNAGQVLQRTLESVLRQEYNKVEHLVIDGCSKDNTVALAQSYKEKSDHEGRGHDVTVVSEPDSGLYDAMNKGLQRASGDYVVFLNAGDVFPSPATLQHVAACVEEGAVRPAVLYGDTDIVDAAGRFLRHRRLAPPEQLSWKSFRQGMLVCHQAFYARTDIARNNPYDLSYRLSADVDWCIRVMKEADRRGLPLTYVHEVVVNYLDGGMSVTGHKASLRERFRLMVHHYGWLSTLVMHAWFVVRAVFKK